MAVPKKRTTLTRRRLRRSHHKVESRATSTCSNCKAVKLNFNICGTCGTYRGRQYHKQEIIERA